MRYIPNNFMRLLSQKDWLSYLFFVVVAIAFWHQILFFDRFPWIGDLSRQYYPWYQELFKHLHAFKLPFWISEMGAGYPLFAQGEVGVFYPVNWLLIFLFSASTGFKLFFPIHSIIASVNSYLFARSIQLSKTSAIFSALVFSYSFFFTTRFIHPSILATAAFMPLGLLAIEKLFTSKKQKLHILLSLTVALQMLVGHPQIAFISILAYALYFLLRLFSFKNEKVINRIGIFSINVLLGFGVAAVQLLPTAALAQASSRINQGVDFIFSYSLPKSQYLTYLFPYLFGISPANNNSGFFQFGGHYWEFGTYIGILPIAFTVIALAKWRKGWQVKILLILFLFFALTALGGYNPAYRLIIRTLGLPFRVSARFLLPITLALSMLAGIGLDILLKDQKAGIQKLLFVPTGIVLFLISASMVTYFNLTAAQSFFQEITSRTIFTEFQKITLANFSLSNKDIILSTLLIIFSSILIAMWQRRTISKKAFIVFAFTMFLTDVFLQGILYQQFESSKILSPPNFVTHIQRNREERIFTFTQPQSVPTEKLTLQPNINLVWDVASINAVTPLPLEGHDVIYNAARENIALTSTFNASYVISQTVLTEDFLKLIDYQDGVYLYENSAALPNAFMVYDYLVTDSNEQSINRLSTIQYETTVTLEKNPELPRILKGDEPVYTIVGSSNNTDLDMGYTVNSDEPGIFVLLDSYYPEWHAFVDGVEVEILRTNGIFRGVVVPKGVHTITFKYLPYSFYMGLSISIFSITLLLFLAKIKFLKT